MLLLRVLRSTRNTHVAIPCPMASGPHVGVSTVHYERLLHVLRLIMWR